MSYIWNIPIKRIEIKQQGKLKLVSPLCSVDKHYADEVNNVFMVNFRTGERYYKYSTYKI